jgi:hypothetical protein
MKPAITACLLALSFASVAAAHPLQARALPLGDYFALGVEHILGGFDHLLFVLGLLVATRSLRMLALTISAFTVAHSITLGLGLFEVVTPNSAVIEVLIALSIAYVGYENVRLRRTGEEPSSTRVWVVLGFGLAHGFGFAGAIHDVGLPRDQALSALALFNLGVEAGQLAVVVLAWPLLQWLRRWQRPARALVFAVNAALIVGGVGWTLERSFTQPEEATASTAPAVMDEPAASLERAPAIDPESVSPWIAPLCRALHALPRERRAACSGEKPGVLLTSACEGALSASLHTQSVRLDEAQARACIAGMEARYEGCEWSDARVMPALPACQAVLEGARAEGTRCASSLECGQGLYCRGASTFDQGVCSQPQAAGARCELAADSLASYVPSPPDTHRECQQSCTRGRCG